MVAIKELMNDYKIEQKEKNKLLRRGNKAVLEISPSYLIKTKNKNMLSKFRIVSDACFR